MRLHLQSESPQLPGGLGIESAGQWQSHYVLMGTRCGAALLTDIKVLDSGGRGDFQLDLNHHYRTRDGAEGRREVLLHRLLSSHGRDTFSHALMMQLLAVEMLDDIVVATSHFVPNSFGKHRPLSQHGRKTHSPRFA